MDCEGVGVDQAAGNKARGGGWAQQSEHRQLRFNS